MSLTVSLKLKVDFKCVFFSYPWSLNAEFYDKASLFSFEIEKFLCIVVVVWKMKWEIRRRVTIWFFHEKIKIISVGLFIVVHQVRMKKVVLEFEFWWNQLLTVLFPLSDFKIIRSQNVFFSVGYFEYCGLLHCWLPDLYMRWLCFYPQANRCRQVKKCDCSI